MTHISYIFHFVIYWRVFLFKKNIYLSTKTTYCTFMFTCIHYVDFHLSCQSAHECVCVRACVCGLSATGSGCPCLLVMDTNGPGQASMEQGGRFVCVTPSCCPRPGRGEGRRGGRPPWGSGSPSACITLNINTHCSAA